MKAERSPGWFGFLGASLVAAVFAGSAIAAAPLKKWNPTDTLTASDLNGNFENLDGRVALLEAARPMVTFNGKKFSLDAIYCGATATPSLGNMGGHEGTKSLCEFACKTSSAHMCSVAELQRSYSLGKKPAPTITSGWVNNTFGGPNEWGTAMSDCRGWTDSASAPGSLGSAWTVVSGYVSPAQCYSSPQPVLCCDSPP